MNRAARFLCSLTALLLGICPLRGAEPTVVTLAGRADSSAFYLPFTTAFEVPEGTTRIRVNQRFKAVDGRRCNIDLGLFDWRGPGFDSEGFRGWSGGARREFEIATGDATPGYLAGEICAGTWHVIQMATTRGATIDWQLEITLLREENPVLFSSRLADTLAYDRPGEYRIAPHVHTHYSDGRLSPAQVVALARQSGLDGLISTEHNTTSALRIWGDVPQEGFLVMNGMEVTYGHGHWNIIGMPPEWWVDFRMRDTDSVRFAQAVEKVHSWQALAIANHPYDIPFRHDVTLMDGIEVWNAEWDDRDERALLLWDSLLCAGHRLTALASTDFHRGTQIASPHTVVRAERLSTDAVMRAMKAGSAYLATDPATSICFELHPRRGAGVRSGGTIRRSRGMKMTFTSSSAGQLRIFDQQGLLDSRSVTSSERLQIPFHSRSRWVRAELRDASGAMIALTNPIYLSE